MDVRPFEMPGAGFLSLTVGSLWSPGVYLPTDCLSFQLPLPNRRTSSATPLLGSYRRMLEVWQALPTEQKYELSADNIRQIVAARPYPKG